MPELQVHGTYQCSCLGAVKVHAPGSFGCIVTQPVPSPLAIPPNSEIRADGWQSDVAGLRRQVADLAAERRDLKAEVARLNHALKVKTAESAAVRADERRRVAASLEATADALMNNGIDLVNDGNETAGLPVISRAAAIRSAVTMIGAE